MIELRLNITESKILSIVKLKKLKQYSFLMLARRTNIIEDKIVLRYEKSGNKLDLRSFF
jgi:hypothetical protein